MIKIRIRIPGSGESVATVDGDEAVIGRDPGCDVQVPVPYVSGVHAKLMVGAVVLDQGSRNGVWVDGRRITQPSLLPNTAFQLGSQPDKSPEVEILETSLSGGGSESAMRRLQEENEALRRRIQELEAGAEGEPPRASSGTLEFPASPEPEAAPPHEKAREAAPASFVDFASFFHQPSAEPKAPPVPARPPSEDRSPKSGPAPAASTGGPPPQRDRARVLEMIDKLISEDVGDRLPIIQGSVEEFFTLESFRLLRQVEKVVTRIARDFKELYDMKTLLPDSEGNFRTLAADVLTDPDNREARQRLVNYLDDLRRWLGVSLAATRKAALRFTNELKRDLSLGGLTEERAIPAWKKLLGQEGAELWNRTREYLRGLDGDRIEERLDDYAKEFASEVMDRQRGSIESLYR